MTTLSIISMHHSQRYQRELESSPRANLMRDLIAIMDALTLEQYDAFVDSGPDDNKAFAQYVAEKRAALAKQAPIELPDSFETPGGDPDADPAGYMRAGY